MLLNGSLVGHSRRALSFFAFAAAISITVTWLYFVLSNSSRLIAPGLSTTTTVVTDPQTDTSDILAAAKNFYSLPLDGPDFTDQFGPLGERLEQISKWLSTGVLTHTTPSVDDILLAQFPWLQSPSQPSDRTPFTTLRKSIVPGSRGIVIPAGANSIRYAGHLISSIRTVFKCQLPIQIVYAGDEDLPIPERELLKSLDGEITFLDLLSVFNDTTLELTTGGWAMKPFAVLASHFEQVILLDADVVFFQSPEVLFDHESYQKTGALFFHDRLLWQHAFAHRHEWWKKQMQSRIPSDALNQSLVWTEDYAEEADSGVVVIDKSHISILLGLLHICWQLRVPVREEVTYKMTYGDKEAWWFGLELSGAPYAFEKYYGSIVGWRKENDDTRVCSFTIAHLDARDKLLWWNGSLLKNKAIDKLTYEVPNAWMMNATWEKGASKPEMSCMVGGEVHNLTKEESDIVEQSVAYAKAFDTNHADILQLS